MKNEKGQAVVELALVLPVLLLLMAGIFEFGKMMYMYSHLHMAAQETVRLGGLGRGDTELTEFARDYIDLKDADDLGILISPTENTRTHGGYVTVKLSYPYTFSTPLLSSVFPSSFLLETESTIRVE